MLHSKHITVSAGSSAAAPEITYFKVNKGVINHVYLSFPAGCAGLVGVRVSLESSPILPVDKDAYIRGDDYTFDYPLFVEVLDEPMTITVEAWNTDDTYDHTIDLQLLIVNKEWVQPVGAYEGIIAALRSIFRR